MPSDSVRRILFAVRPECTSSVLRPLEGLGAILEYRHDAVGYLRLRIPDAALRRIPDIGGIDAIMVAPTFAQLAAHPPFARRGVVYAQSQDMEQQPPRRNVTFDARLLADNPYTSAVGIGAETFRARHPTYDGRGVTVSVKDGGIDPLMPQLRTARSLDGKPKTKIVDIFTTNDSRIADPGSGWLAMRDTVRAAGRTARYAGTDYVVPRPGRYRIAQFDERSEWAPSVTENDMDRDGNPPGSSGTFGVLWDEATNTVWVDTDRDRDFTNEKPMTDYRERFDIGVFGPHIGAADSPDSLGFAVQIDRLNKAVNLLTGDAHHAASSTTATGSNYFGGDAGGVAPGASLVAISSGFNTRASEAESSAYYAVEALIRAATHPRVDVIMDYGLGGLDFNDGTSVDDIITRRVLELYRKPLAQAANNAGPALGTAVTAVGDGLSIGAYTARETWRANYGLEIQDGGRIRTYSGRGPSADGAPAPSLLAPSGFLAGDLTLDRSKRPTRPGGPPYEMPNGYQRFGGTSQATPAAAGAMALLVSAAKQNGVAWDARRIAVALITSARPIEGYGAHEQGAGLIQVEAAWGVLQRLIAEPPVIISEAPVRTAWSDSLDPPGRGRGLYEREGWRVGQRESRTVVLERVTGPSAAKTYRLAWSHNDGTFTAPSTVALPRGEPVDVRVTIEPKAIGVHSALLSVIDPAMDAVLYQVLHTIVAAEMLSASNEFRVRYEGRLPFARVQSFFVDVPPSASELRITVQGDERPITAGLARPTVGFNGAFPETIDRAATCEERRTDSGESAAPHEVEIVCTASRPHAGVWEAFVQYPAGFDPLPATASDGANYVVTAEVLPGDPEGGVQ